MSIISLDSHKKAAAATANCTTSHVLHLPVAPQIVARTRFSPPPPPKSSCLMVREAVELLRTTAETSGKLPQLVALSGPGDPLATPDITLDVANAIREEFPAIPIGLRTYGIGSKELATALAKAGVTYVQMITDAIVSEIFEKVYAWIRPGLKTLKLSDASALLIEEQRYGIPALGFAGIQVCIETTLYPGYNLHHIYQIARETGELGAEGMALIPYQAVEGVEVELESPNENEIREITTKVEKQLPIVEPLIADPASLRVNKQSAVGSSVRKPSKEKPNVAVVSSNGIEVDLHLGRAKQFLIYGPRKDGLTCLLEARRAPAPGKGHNRWDEVSHLLEDCFVLLAASAGEAPRTTLSQKGLQVVLTEDNIEGTVDALYGDGKKGKKQERNPN